jgi:hypothetical protein
MPVKLDDAAALAASFPGAIEATCYRNRAWYVGKKLFAWVRPFSKADLKRFAEAGDPPPTGDIFAVVVPDLLEKEAALEANPKAFFDIPHLKGVPAFLIQLSKVTKTDLKRALATARATCGP